MHESGHKRRAAAPVAAVALAAALVAFAGCDVEEGADLDRGQQLFVENCGSCHALTEAGTSAEVGPDLDAAFRAARAAGMDQDTIEGVVETQIAYPRPSSPDNPSVYMPADLVTGEDATDVAAFVGMWAGNPEAEPPEFSAPEFFATNCGSCHVLEAAGTTGEVGPNLDEVLPGQSADQVAESITDPDATLTPGFQAGVMPANFGQALTEEQLMQLVQYLLESIGGGGGGGAGGAGGG